MNQMNALARVGFSSGCERTVFDNEDRPRSFWLLYFRKIKVNYKVNYIT